MRAIRILTAIAIPFAAIFLLDFVVEGMVLLRPPGMIAQASGLCLMVAMLAVAAAIGFELMRRRGR